MNRLERMEQALRSALAPDSLQLRDDSARHAGHAGARPEGETHYFLQIVAAAFTGQPKVRRHQMVYDALAQEFTRGLHALSIDARAPGE